MDTTRNAETPPNFAPKTFQKWPEKLPNVASETLEKNIWAAFGVAFLSLCRLQLCNFATRNSSTDGHHSKRWNTTYNFAPKTFQKWPEKLPNVASEILEKKTIFGLPLA